MEIIFFFSFQNLHKFQAAIGTLQAVSLPIVDKDICNEYFPGQASDHFCAGGDGKCCNRI